MTPRAILNIKELGGTNTPPLPTPPRTHPHTPTHPHTHTSTFPLHTPHKFNLQYTGVTCIM